MQYPTEINKICFASFKEQKMTVIVTVKLPIFTIQPWLKSAQLPEHRVPIIGVLFVPNGLKMTRPLHAKNRPH